MAKPFGRTSRQAKEDGNELRNIRGAAIPARQLVDHRPEKTTRPLRSGGSLKPGFVTDKPQRRV